LLVRWRGGDSEALESLMPLVYDELRRLAHSYLRREHRDHTLPSAALVNEAFMRMTGSGVPEWRDRLHFFGIAGHVMRQILVEYARTRGRVKRGGGAYMLTITDAEKQPKEADVDIVALDNALNDLSKIDQQQGRVVELRFFAGLSIEETAEALGISASTVKRDWNRARVWLYRELDRTAAP
jgi:RNA polymerase sigma factor (TIGR02999 family)